MKVEISLAITLVLLALEVKNFVLEGGLGKEIAYTLAKLILLFGITIYCIFLLNMPHIVNTSLENIIRERQKLIVERNHFKQEQEIRQNWRRNELPIVKHSDDLFCRALRRRSVS